MILLDSNIFMYASGTPHPHKQPSVALLQQVATGALEAAIDAEVLQEILHRYRSIQRWPDGCKVYDLTQQIMGTVLPITSTIMDKARLLMDLCPSIMARDAVHAAVCLYHDMKGICSYDKDFDMIPGIQRYEPEQLLMR